MMYSQINILNDKDRRFNYYIEYIDDSLYTRNQFTYKVEDTGVFFYCRGEQNLLENNSTWYEVDPESGSTQYLTESINISSLNLYFPQYAVETYDISTWYSIKISTFINGVEVVLGSYLISRKDALASSKTRTFKNQSYQECINIPFIDPWYLCYDDDWKDFRREVCKATPNQINSDIVNNEGAIILVEIIPIEEGSEYWIEKTGYTGGICSLPLSQDRRDRLYTTTRVQLLEHTTPHILSETLFNAAYEQDLAAYMLETYNLDITDCYTHIELVVKDAENIYKYLSYDSAVNVFETSHIFTKAELRYESWDDYIDGMYIVSSLSIKDEDDSDLFTVVSSEIPLTSEIFKFLIITDLDSEGGYLNLDYIHMQSYQVDVVNKIEKNVISVSKPDDYKANILKPIFVQVSSLGDTIFHPQVTENVCIDLNAFKSKVNTFYLRLEGVDFVEVGRTSAGVVFKVIGSSLPNNITNGVFYILNQDKDLVVTGNYTYIQ